MPPRHHSGLATRADRQSDCQSFERRKPCAPPVRVLGLANTLCLGFTTLLVASGVTGNRWYRGDSATLVLPLRAKIATGQDRLGYGGKQYQQHHVPPDAYGRLTGRRGARFRGFLSSIAAIALP